MSKEHIGRRIVATGLTIAGVALGLREYHSVQEQRDLARLAIPPIVEHLNERYGVELAFQISEYEKDLGIPFKEPLPIDSLRASQVLQKELSLLSPQLVKAIGPRRIVISQSLGSVGLSERTGATFGECRFVYLSAQKSFLEYDNSFRYWLRHVVHHELYHVADSLDGIEVDNASWDMLSLDTGKFHLFGHPGFTSDYAEVSSDEDQAEVAALLFDQGTDAGNKEYDKSANDPVVQAKIAEMKHRYSEWSGGAINEQYWIDLRAGNIDEAYWDERDTNRN